ncbi:hypothetical protein SK803_14425 [Lentzea sp. BCCO 10_0856]|uniref:Uncharacterized protein n=1 Tax=Lentzea miocenica TaxID=3095431 RepID=A0ABU4T024_9PSEU|nr:hypothetical protein [Lentzea sp. BCCO 10_0856]MDX8031419.1 hypothetical protein [Lentzea sp. BCCO 10_0856]
MSQFDYLTLNTSQWHRYSRTPAARHAHRRFLADGALAWAGERGAEL